MFRPMQHLAFIQAQEASALSSPGLRQAAFCVGFRQEFHLALFQQRPFSLPLDIYDSYRLWRHRRRRTACGSTIS